MHYSCCKTTIMAYYLTESKMFQSDDSGIQIKIWQDLACHKHCHKVNNKNYYYKYYSQTNL